MTTAFTKDQLIEHAKRRLNYSRCGCRISDSDRALDEALIETAIATLECLAATATPAVQAEQEPVGIVRYVDIGLPDTKGIHATFYTQLPEGTELFSRPAQAEQLSGNTEQVSQPRIPNNQ